MAPAPKSFVLDLLSTLRRGTMPVGALVEAGELFGIPGGSLRVALARLRAAGVVESDERGRYRLSARAVARRLASWRSLEERTRRWDGGWLAAHLATADPKVGRGERKGRAKALHLLGFECLTPTLALRPDNLRVGVEDVREELRGLGLPDSDLVFELRSLDPAREADARRLWNVDELRDGYRRLLAEIEKSAARLPNAPVREAMVESFLIGGRALRALVLDPLLPDEICPSSERRALHAAMRAYDRLGRAAWARLLSAWDVPHLRGPMDSRLAVTPSSALGMRGADPERTEGMQP